MKRKLIAFMAAVLAMLSLVSPASAITGNKANMVIEAECEVPDITIDVTVPGNLGAVINPTKISVEVGGTVDNSQIISEPAYIENQSYSENILTLDAWGEGYFHLFGAMSEESAWKNTDTFGAVFVLSFSAAPVEAENEEELSKAPTLRSTIRIKSIN